MITIKVPKEHILLTSFQGCVINESNCTMDFFDENVMKNFIDNRIGYSYRINDSCTLTLDEEDYNVLHNKVIMDLIDFNKRKKEAEIKKAETEKAIQEDFQNIINQCTEACLTLIDGGVDWSIIERIIRKRTYKSPNEPVYSSPKSIYQDIEKRLIEIRPELVSIIQPLYEK